VEHGLFRYARHVDGRADGRADGATFNQAGNNSGALFGSEAVHTSIMPYGLRIVNSGTNIFATFWWIFHLGIEPSSRGIRTRCMARCCYPDGFGARFTEST
jgi:hypothetical protein